MRYLLLSALLIFQFHGITLSQSKTTSRTIPYIEFYECFRCEELIISAPAPKYPTLVGTGPHVYNGLVSVQVTVGADGSVKVARAISGHPYFRKLIETAALDAKLKPALRDGKKLENNVVLTYQVVSSRKGTILRKKPPIINGIANYLPNPELPNHLLCADGWVEVEVFVNKSGRVRTAMAKSGHPLLYTFAEAAARKARFKKFDDLPSIQMRGIVVYNFPRAANCPVK